MNRKKSGVICSHPRLQRLVELATALRAQCPFGLVVGYGPVEPAGWEQLWRQVLGAPAATVFRWRSASPEAELLAGRAAAVAAAAKAGSAEAEGTAAVAEAAAQEAAAVASIAVLASEFAAPCGVARLPQSISPRGLVEAARALAEAAVAARAKAAEAAEQAAIAAAGAEAAAAEAVDPRALAAAATVWLAFECIPPPDEVQQVLRGNRGIWLPTAGAEPERLQQAKLRVQADGAEDRWARGAQLALPVVGAIKDLGVVQGFGKQAKDLQAARTRAAVCRLELVGRLGLPRKALCRLVAASALTAGLFGSACHVYDSDALSAMRNWVMHALYRGSRLTRFGCSCTWCCRAPWPILGR